MESLAFLHSAVEYESKAPIPELTLDWHPMSGTLLPLAPSLVAAALILGSASSAWAASGIVRTSTGGPLNVRDRPGGAVLRTIPNGSQVQLTGREQNGFLELTDGAWVAKEFVQVEQATPGATPTGATPPAGAKTGVVKTGGPPLNVRKTPGGEIVGTVPDGTILQLTGQQQQGFLERTDKTWVDQQYVQVEGGAVAVAPATTTSTTTSPAPAPAATTPAPASPAPAAIAPASPIPPASPAPSPASPAPTAAAVQTGTVRTNGQPLNVRDRPNGSIVTTVPDGSQLQLTGRQQDGFLERTDGTWVASQFVMVSATPAPPAPSPTPRTSPQPGAGGGQITPTTTAPVPTATSSSRQQAIVRTNGSNLNVRRSPGGAIIGSLPNGTPIELTGRRSGSWVERTNGTWVSANWISTGSTPTPSPQPPIGSDRTTAFVRTNGSNLNVRRSPGGAIIGSLPNGTRIELTGRRSGSWVQRTDGTWVSGDWIASRPSVPPDIGGDVSVGIVRTNGSYLNVRRSPGGVVIDSVPNGTRLELTGRRADGWLQLTNGGWVSADWVVQ